MTDTLTVHIGDPPDRTDLEDRLAAVAEQLSTYREQFDADAPQEVSLLDSTDPIEKRWEKISEWQTLERRADLLDAARQRKPVGRQFETANG